MSGQADTVPTQKAWTITKGDLVIDFGTSNQQLAWEFLQLMRNPQVTFTYKGQRL